MPNTRNQKSLAPAEREEDDSIPISSPSRKHSLGPTSDQSKKRPKPKANIVPTRAQPRRSSSSQGENITNHASSSKLLAQLDNDSEENGTSTGKEAHNLTQKRPKARPVKAQEKNGYAPYSSQSTRQCARDKNYEESENSSEDQDEEEDARDSDYEFGVEKKKKGSRKKNGTKADGEEQVVRLILPKLSNRDEEMEQLHKYRDLLSQNESINDDDLEHFQEESFELPESSRDLKNCPICHKSLPKKPSEELRNLLDFWLGKIKNGAGLSSSTATVECCELHEFEKLHLPLAKKKKWPKVLSEKEIEADLLKDDELRKRLMDLVINPEKSHFYIRQKERREKDGRQAGSIQSQMRYFHEQQAGYFGELGAIVIRRTILLLFEDQNNPTHTLEDFTNRPNKWMEASEFVDQVLFPEVVCALIQKHEKKSWKKKIEINEAERIRDESNVYGSIMFSVDKEEGKDTDGSLFESNSPVSKKRISSGSQGRNCSQTRRKSTYTHEEAIEVSSAQPSSSSRSTRYKARKHEPSSQQNQTPSASPNRPRPRPSQSGLFQQKPKLDFFGELQYSSQDRIKSWDVPQFASSPDLQASSSSTAHKDSVLGSSQIASDGTSPLTELETIQNDSTDF